MKELTIFVAYDGTQFDTGEACESYEANIFQKLVYHIDHNIDGTYNERFDTDIIEVDNVANYILEFKDELFQILTSTVTPL